MASGGNIEVSEEALAELCRRYYVRELALFGSVLRDDFRADSDIDLLVEFEAGAPIGLFQYAAFQRELEALYGRKVDLVSKDGLHPLIRDSVLNASGPPERRERLPLTRIVETCDEIRDVLDGRDRDAFHAHDMLQSAVLHQLTVLAACVPRVPEEIRARYGGVAWERVANYRDFVTRYWDVNLDDVWRAATVDIPELRTQVADILAAEFPEEQP